MIETRWSKHRSHDERFNNETSHTLHDVVAIIELKLWIHDIQILSFASRVVFKIKYLYDCSISWNNQVFFVVTILKCAWRNFKSLTNSLILLKDVNDCHCITSNTIEITYRNKYKLTAQMFLVVIDLDTLRLVDQSEILISFVFILRSSVIVLSNTFTRWQSCSLHSWMRLSLNFNSCTDVTFIEC